MLRGTGAKRRSGARLRGQPLAPAPAGPLLACSQQGLAALPSPGSHKSVRALGYGGVAQSLRKARREAERSLSGRGARLCLQYTKQAGLAARAAPRRS